MSSFISGGRQRARRRLCSLGQHPPTAPPGHRSGSWSSACSMVTAATFGPTAATAGGSGTLRRRAVPRQGDLADAAHVAGAEGRPALRHRGGRSRRQRRQRRRKTVNQTLYSVDTPAQAIAKYQPGGVIYYTTRGLLRLPQRRQHRRSRAGRHPVQRAPDRVAGAAAPASRCRSRWTRRAARCRPLRPPGDADARQRWPSAPTARRRTPVRLGRGDRHGAEGGRGDPGLRRRLRRQHQPEQPRHRGPLTRRRSRAGLADRHRRDQGLPRRG